MNKCTNCGYVSQPEDESAFTPTTECPKCHAIYEKGERLLLKKEYEKAEEWLAEKEKGRSQDGDLSDDDFGKAEDNYYNQGCKAFDAGYYENAVEKFTKALQRDPSHAKALANRGIAYRKLKRNIEATADLKKAELLGSTVAKDYFLRKSQMNKIILVTVAVIVPLMIIGVWQNNNKKNQREEVQKRQAEIQKREVIAEEQARIQAALQAKIQAEQARIKAEQERASASFSEEFMREWRKKVINDALYRRDSYDPGRSLDQAFKKPRDLLDESRRRMEMEDIAREQAKQAIRHDRILHGEPPL